MIALFLVVAALVVAGHAASEWLWERERGRARSLGPPSALERVVSTATCALAVALALDWLLGFSHLLRPVPLVATAVALGASGAGALVFLRRRRPPAAPIEVPARPTMLVLALAAPAILWVTFVMWRATILPVLSHDGLNYHMPKAVMMMRTGAAGYFDDAANARIFTYPNDYELLLTDVLTLTGSDSLTAWPTTWFYVLLLVTSTALAERFWGRGWHVLGAPLLAGATPLALYHAGAHKNDLMFVSLTLAMALWGARWVASGELAPALLCILCALMGAGTKFNGVFGGAVLVAVLGAALVLQRGAFARVLSRAELAALAGAAVLGAGLLGGATYVENLRHSHTLQGPPGETALHSGYGAWGQLWKFPVLLLMVPFSSRTDAVWVPWRGEWWWWPAHDWYFSHFGVAFTIAVLLTIPCVLRYRRDAGGKRPLQRLVASALLAGAFFVVLPIRGGPSGLFNSYPRYVQFVVPLVACWTVVPLLRELAQKARVAAGVVLAALSAAFGAQAVWCATHDFFIPFPYLEEAIIHPGTRFIPCNPMRAGSIVDRMAAPEDIVAVDGDYDTNVYPVYGAGLTRHVVYIARGDGPAVIPPEGRWVIVDRSWNAVWNNPDFTDMGKAFTLLFRGKITDDDLRVVRQLRHDPRYKLVYRNKPLNQAVFVRADQAPPGLPEEETSP